MKPPKRDCMKPLKRDHIGDRVFGPCIRLVPSQRFSFKFIVCHSNPPHNDVNNHVIMNFTMIMSQFCLASTSCGPIGKIFFEVARTNPSYRASFILAYSDARGAC